MTSPFKKVKAPTAAPKDPEELFAELKKNEHAPSLWLHQGDVLRSYSKSHVNHPDVLLELPTGTGKTLLGLLIGEWRRRALNEPVLFLCPTRQLAKQVANAALEKHNIEVVRFIGKKSEFARQDLTEYVTARKIAVATYSVIFNAKPGLEPPGFLILDDAHAAETYVAGAWSLSIERKKFEDTFSAVVELFRGILPSSFQSRLEHAAVTDHALNFELVSSEDFAAREKEFTEILDARLNPDGDKDTFFRWQMIKNHLQACNLFLSPTGLLLRPMIAPTWDSQHFASPKQRLYMSATAGISGDIERMFGRSGIARIGTPAMFKQRAVGRRLFLFPDAAMKTDVILPWAASLPSKYGRAAYLARDGERAATMMKLLTKRGVTVFDAEDIEDDLSPFTESNTAALVATARFDGIDLPGDTCRMLVVYGRPDAVNLQERFFLARLGMKDILRDRMLTRFTQAVGRCTRGQADYAVIVPLGRSLFDFCAKTETQAYLHPELAAEIKFGIEQMPQNEAALDAMIAAFLQQGEEWADADEGIKAIRDVHKQVQETNVSKFLATTAAKEVNFVRALWAGQESKAAEIAREICDSVMIPDLAPFRAWWAYQAASRYAALVTQNVENAEPFRDRYRAIALSASGTSSWYGRVIPVPAKKLAAAKTAMDPLIAKNLAKFFDSVGTRGPKFEEYLALTEAYLGAEAHGSFEQGLQRLGTLLGWDTERPGGDADPDSVWRLPPEMVVGLEAKSEESEGNGLSKKTLNQAHGHYAWLEHKGAPREKSRVVVVSPRMSIHKLALPHVKDLWHITPTEMMEFFASVTGTLRVVRSQIVDAKAEETPALIEKTLFEEGFSAQEMLAKLFARRVEDLPTSED